MDAIKAVVQKVIRDGKHGPFAVATCVRLDGSVTFSLEPTVWKEQEWPENGMVVFLGELRQKRAGWRAKYGRFWKPSDEHVQHTERSTPVAQFLYPTSRQFPFDEACEHIVRELERRGWHVPGIDVEFREYGSGEQRFRLVSQLRSREWQLVFGRLQGSVSRDHWNNTAGVTTITIPRQELHVYHDESGPTLYRYVGNDYDRDREQFMVGLKVNSKLHGEPRLYLVYKGECHCRNGGSDWFSKLPHTHSGYRSPYLAHSNDLGREYDCERGEPTLLHTAEVMAEFTAYLERVALAAITSHPVPDRIEVPTEQASTPFPASIGPLFWFGEHHDAERINEGKRDIQSLHPAERYGLSGDGYRLVPLGDGDKSVPQIAYEGFLWCGIGEVTESTPIEVLEIPGRYRWADRDRFVIRVTPKRADGIYIADHAAYERRRRELAEAHPARERFTSEEVIDFMSARGRTISPISEYQGGFEQPVVLINRELSLEEVEVVSGPHESRFDR